MKFSGPKLREARLARGLSQSQLGKLASVPREHIGHYEHGRRHPSLRRAAEFARAVGMPLDALLVEEDQPNGAKREQVDA